MFNSIKNIFAPPIFEDGRQNPRSALSKRDCIEHIRVVEQLLLILRLVEGSEAVF